MKIALGTVQFGKTYGVANTNGQVEKTEVKNILDFAKVSGVDTIDTAITYETAEQCLGEIGMDDYNVITKLPEIPDDFGNLRIWVVKHLQKSLNFLKVKTLSGLLLHRPSQLLDKDKKDLWNILLNLKKDGIIKKIGFSIYTPDELDKLWSLFKPDLVQAPYNIFDRRLETSGWLQKMSEEKVEIHIRSIFLQGLLLMDEKSRPEKFKKWPDLWAKWNNWFKENDSTPVQTAVSFALSDSRISKVIVGVDSLKQFKDIINAANNICQFPESFHIEDTRLLNPSEWSSL
ncbi:aldo/keto reductase [Candidatus Pelagibacter sp. Uisw_090]|uniref:aldo/keto reductase n=1 Tax=Candidatus Pelagibacter sp. Uisw_090 TaxID=3230993 RepID=UPI0039E785C0